MVETTLADEILLAGRYAHLRELGRGATGRVLLVEDRLEGGARAVKIVSAADAERLRWELTLLASLAHPGLARVHELVTVREPLGAPFRLEPGAAALVEEHVDGASAAEAVAALGSDEERVRFAVSVGIAVARALSAIHAAGLVHGDVKPANVVVPDDPSASRLVDLGLARAAGITATVSGTPAYLAPEAWLGERSVATDLFALGATLHALCTGRTAFDTEGSTRSFARALTARPSPSELPASAPLSLRRLVGDLLAEQPSDRPLSAREVALRLAALASEVGATVADAAAMTDAPSPLERAARAALRPLVGRSRELSALLACTRETGAVIVSGPPGVGRSRLVREAVRALQMERAQQGESVPTYVVVRDGRIPRLRHDAVLHLEACRTSERASWDAAVEAAALDGVRLAIVAEPSDALEGGVSLGPLDDTALRRLIAELLEVDPAPALVRAARAASGGLPGRLCRLVAEGFEAGLDPTRPPTLEELGRRGGVAVVPEAARPLAELLAAAGGALEAEPAAALCDGAAQQGRVLRALGLAHEERGRIALRPDVEEALSRSLAPPRRRAIAERLATVALDSLARAHVCAALGDAQGALRAFAGAMHDARRAGDPERAAAIGGGALRTLDPAPLALRLATADALRARAREIDALAMLEAAPEPEAAAARAELARLIGDHPRARREAEDALSRLSQQLLSSTSEDDESRQLRDAAAATARGVLARAALAEGDAASALEMMSIEGASELPAAIDARRWELRAFAELALGRTDEAHEAAARSLLQARRSGSPAVEARAVATEGVVLAALGRLDEAAARHERAFELADAAGERHAAASYLVNVGLGRLERGQAGPAIEALREGARRLTELARRSDATRALYNLGNAAALVGDDDLARDAIRRASAWAAEVGDASVAALAAVVQAELLLRAGKVDGAERILETAFGDRRPPDTVRATVGARLAIVQAVSGRVEVARATIEQAALLCAIGAEAEIAVARARVALAGGAEAEACREADDALRLVRTAGWESRLRAELIAAECFERGARSTDAHACLARVRVLLDGAALSLPVRARARLRVVPAYQRALGAAPSSPRVEDGGRWRALAAHGKRLVRESRIPRLVEAIVDAAVELADAERGFLVGRLPDGSLRVHAARAFGADLEGERPSESVVGRVLDGGRALVAVDALSDERLDRAASVHAMALRSVLAVPLPLRGGRSMALVLDDRVRPGAFDESTVALLGDLAELASGALEAAEALHRERRDRRRLARDRTRLFAQIESQERELGELRRRTEDTAAFAGIVAESEVMRRALRMVERVALSDAPVLLRGESGTGKELVARALHDASPRRQGAYVSENVSAIPETLLESALFGHVRGAFTGADRARRGLFEIADGGTLFLDEIGEMSEALQAKLLRVLQDGELRPIGSEHVRRVDVRVVAATHRDLERLVSERRFREDLFYRIAVVQVELPPLRERPEDVAPLVAAFLERHAAKRRVRVDRAAMAALRVCLWPGNVRQLENEVRRALVMAEDVIGLEHLSRNVRGDEAIVPEDELDLKGHIDALERRLIRVALERTLGNQTRAAELLGLSRYGLAKMIKRLAFNTVS